MTESTKRLGDQERDYYLLTRRVYRLLAPWYDLVTLPLATARNKVAAIAGAPPGSTVLDVATGTAQQAFAFARRRYNVTGIDLSEAMLRTAASKNKYGDAHFARADATGLPFEHNRFDVSCVSFALHEMPLAIREKALEEMIRVTNHGGIVIVVDYALPRSTIGRALTQRLISLYEAEYYSEFVRCDLNALLENLGVQTVVEIPLLRGVGRILKGTKRG